MVDLRIEKVFVLPRGSLGLILDALNVFNIDTVNSKRTRTSAAGNFGEPLSFVEPRELRIGVRFIF